MKASAARIFLITVGLFLLGVFFVTQAHGAEKPIGTWSMTRDGKTDSLELFDSRGECPSVARRAVYNLRGKVLIGGCYVVREETVFLLFEDGDRVRMPVKAITWKPGHAPATL